ncbi:hypothetical protein [Ramlibacter montanisoli]|uniref:Uncharacterized protein n=1 Tax=Ramlibacter montanisoli TaxID=2732512 RepID=A0A849KF73_9BURK|nr:hypothetical protein [Ramlibacter montanisoli]NNU43585.1 hypothetical protein [Ramlibacter montanisoli]
MGPGDWKHFRATALVLLAGEAAERGFYESEGLDIPDSEHLRSGRDRQELHEHLGRVFGDGVVPGQYSPEQLFKVVDSMVLNLWPKVVSLAEALLQHKKLSASEIAAVISTHAIVWDDEP